MKLDLNAIVCKLVEDGLEIEFLDHYAHCSNCHYVGADIDPGFSECNAWIEYKYGTRPVRPKTVIDKLIEGVYEPMLIKQIYSESETLNYLPPKSNKAKND